MFAQRPVEDMYRRRPSSLKSGMIDKQNLRIEFTSRVHHRNGSAKTSEFIPRSTHKAGKLTVKDIMVLLQVSYNGYHQFYRLSA